MNRIIHRIGALLAALLMLWLGGTGVGMQLLDFNSILSHDPPTDPTQLSIIEGMYGPGNFTVIQLPDFTAAALPKDFDINKGMDIVLQATRAPQQPNDQAQDQGEQGSSNGGQRAPVSWIELRVTDGIPVGRVMRGTDLEAFNAQTGEPVTAVPHEQLPQGARLPYSLRQKLKTLHRFWNRGDVPGVYFEFLSGLVLFGLLITGLILYFKLLNARAKIGRKEWFWLTGGVWRGLHRAVSVLSAVFLIIIAFTGTWIGYESSYSALHRGGGGGPAPAIAGQQPGMGAAGGMGAGGGRNQVTPVRLEEVPAMTVTTLEAMQRLHPDLPIKAIRLRNFGQMKQAVVITGGGKTDQLLFDTANGQQVGLTEPSYPRSNFPFGVQTHENMKHIHSGDMFGMPTRLMNLFAGLSLLFLSISGIVMYFDMWSKRKKIGRKRFFWTK